MSDTVDECGPLVIEEAARKGHPRYISEKAERPIGDTLMVATRTLEHRVDITEDDDGRVRGECRTCRWAVSGDLYRVELKSDAHEVSRWCRGCSEPARCGATSMDDCPGWAGGSS